MNDSLPPVEMFLPGGLRFSKNGSWINDGKRVTHKKIARYLAQRLRYSTEQQAYIIDLDGKCVTVEIDDTAFVVRAFLTETWPWRMILNDGLEEPFYPETLSCGSAPDGQANVYYCFLKQRNEPARILRPALQTLLPLIIEREGKYFFAPVSNQEYEIGLKTN